MIVIPMAGLSQRFRNEGYTLPKFMLELHGKTLFSHTVGSFRRYFDKQKFVFIARSDNDASEFIQREANLLGIKEYELVILSYETLGQADTVRIGLEQINFEQSEAVTIFNIDTIRPGFVYPERDWMPLADGYIEVTHSEDPGFSYALPENGGEEKVLRTAEKKVISNLASTGLYYFKNFDLFNQSFSEEMRQPSSCEIYIAPLYNHMIKSGHDVRYFKIAESEILYSGTPAQYKSLLDRENLY